MVKESRNGASKRLFLKKGDCSDIFQIPSHLLKSFGPFCPTKATLRVDDSGKKWRVSIEKFKDCYFFTDGWKEFAEQVDLKSLDFLMFNSKQKGKIKKKKESAEGFGVEKKWSFIKEMKAHHRYCVNIPKRFVMGIQLGEENGIKLKGDEGKEWPVRLVKRETGTFSMCGGWCDFVIDNKLMVGSKVSFTWLSGNVVQTQIVEIGTDKEPLFHPANKRETRLGSEC